MWKGGVSREIKKICCNAYGNLLVRLYLVLVVLSSVALTEKKLLNLL